MKYLLLFWFLPVVALAQKDRINFSFPEGATISMLPCQHVYVAAVPDTVKHSNSFVTSIQYFPESQYCPASRYEEGPLLVCVRCHHTKRQVIYNTDYVNYDSRFKANSNHNFGRTSILMPIYNGEDNVKLDGQMITIKAGSIGWMPASKKKGRKRK